MEKPPHLYAGVDKRNCIICGAGTEKNLQNMMDWKYWDWEPRHYAWVTVLSEPLAWSSANNLPCLRLWLVEWRYKKQQLFWGVTMDSSNREDNKFLGSLWFRPSRCFTLAGCWRVVTPLVCSMMKQIPLVSFHVLSERTTFKCLLVYAVFIPFEAL